MALVLGYLLSVAPHRLWRGGSYEAAMLERLDVWLAIFTLGTLAYFELRLGRFVGPIVRGVISMAEPAAKEVKRRASRQLPTTVRLKPRRSNTPCDR